MTYKEFLAALAEADVVEIGCHLYDADEVRSNNALIAMAWLAYTTDII